MRRLLIALVALCVAIPCYSYDFIYVKKKAAAVASATLKLATGNYTGNGSDNRIVVTGLSFTPKVVIVAYGGGIAPAIRTDSMVGDLSCSALGSGGGTNIIESINSDGFTVGTSTASNQDTWAYTWVALGGTEVATGTYTGDGADIRGMTGVGFSPGYMMVLPAPAQSRRPTFRGTNLAGDLSFYGDSGKAANFIQSLDADGFTLGTAVNVNENLSTYYWWAVNSASSSMGQNSYAGNSTDNTNITGLSFDPLFVFAQWDAAAIGVYRHTGMTGDVSKLFTDSDGGLSGNYIQSFGATSFQVGSSIYVNNSGSTYYYWYFRQTP